MHVNWDPIAIGAMASMVLLGTLAAFFLFLEGVKRIGSVRATLVGLSEPVSASIFSWALLGSALAPIDIVGFALMISMVIIVTLVKPKETKHIRVHRVGHPSKTNQLSGARIQEHTDRKIVDHKVPDRVSDRKIA